MVFNIHIFTFIRMYFLAMELYIFINKNEKINKND